MVPASDTPTPKAAHETPAANVQLDKTRFSKSRFYRALAPTLLIPMHCRRMRTSGSATVDLQFPIVVLGFAR